MRVLVDTHGDTPPSRQITNAILDALAAGELTSGDRLPSVRTLAVDALVNANTVAKAYRELEHAGIVVGRNGAGVFVTEDGPALARGLRHDATLKDFAAAARAALRSGVTVAKLERELGVARKERGKA